MSLNFGQAVHDAIFDTDVFGEAASFSPAVKLRSPDQPLVGIFDREHEIVLDDLRNSELKGSGHSTTVPVFTVRLSDFVTRPGQGDRVTVDGQAFDVWDVQPDGRGCADLVLREG